jgi:two-component system, LytTR family, sensor histidine kinase AlgZ
MSQQSSPKSSQQSSLTAPITALTRPPTPELAAWLPNFCEANAVLMLMFAAQLVASIAVLAPSFAVAELGFWSVIGPASVMAQWLALTSAAALCLARGLLARLRPAIAAGTALIFIAINAYVCSWLCFQGMRLMYPQDLALPSFFLLRVMALSVLVAAVALRYMYVQHQWQLQVQANARVQVQALTARIRPHFLFNTLNTATSLVQLDPQRAERVLLDLSELFRAALKSGDDAITLGEELALAQGYLAIEQIRLGPRLRVEIDIANAPLDYRLPPLLLQPLVENAVYHGIQPRLDGGTVTIRCEQSATHWILSVQNPKADHSNTSSAGHGVAHANIQARLRYAFPALSAAHAAGLEIEQSDLHYCAKLRLPIATSSAIT